MTDTILNQINGISITEDDPVYILELSTKFTDKDENTKKVQNSEVQSFYLDTKISFDVIKDPKENGNVLVDIHFLVPKDFLEKIKNE